MARPETWAELIHPDDRERVQEENRRTERTGERFEIEYRFLRRDGSIVWVRDTAVMVERDGDWPVWQGVIEDVTARHEAEARQREAETRYRHLVERLPAAVYIDAVDEMATAIYISPQYEQLTGYSPEDRLAEPGLWLRMLHPDDRDCRGRGVEPHERQRRALRSGVSDHRQGRANGLGPRPRVPGRRPERAALVAGRLDRHLGAQGGGGGALASGSDPRGVELRGRAVPERAGVGGLRRRRARARRRGGRSQPRLRVPERPACRRHDADDADLRVDRRRHRSDDRPRHHIGSPVRRERLRPLGAGPGHRRSHLRTDPGVPGLGARPAGASGHRVHPGCSDLRGRRVVGLRRIRPVRG